MTYTYSTTYSRFPGEVSQSANINPSDWQIRCAERQSKSQTVPFILILLCVPRRVTNRNPSSSVSVSFPLTSLISDTLSRFQVGSEVYIYNNSQIKEYRCKFSDNKETSWQWVNTIEKFWDINREDLSCSYPHYQIIRVI